MESTNPLAEVFAKWTSLAQLAADIGESHWTVIKWKKRRNIPTRYWQSICDAAKRRGERLTVGDLMRVHSTRSPFDGSSRAGASAG